MKTATYYISILLPILHFFWLETTSQNAWLKIRNYRTKTQNQD